MEDLGNDDGSIKHGEELYYRSWTREVVRRYTYGLFYTNTL